MVWDVLEAWGDDPPFHPVIHKSKGMDRVSPKPPLSDLADASNDFDVFCNRPNRQTAKNANEGMDPPSFPATVAAKTAQTAKSITVGPWSFAEHLNHSGLRVRTKIKEWIPARSNFTKPGRY